MEFSKLASVCKKKEAAFFRQPLEIAN